MDKGGRTAVSFAWAAVPLVTLGLGTAPAFLYPALRRRRPGDWISLALYLALTTLGLVGTEAESVMSDVSTVALLAAWIGGTVHAFAIRSRVFATKNRYLDAIAMASQRRELRSAARDTARDPAMAWELRIGRPDLQRGFDDGGLVDVNHAPPSVLASLPGMTPELVNRIVETRDQLSGFSSVEELSSLAQLPPSLTGALNEYAIFL
jgi:DNA uptake protein ComE-like DNA-binding protein